VRIWAGESSETGADHEAPAFLPVQVAAGEAGLPAPASTQAEPVLVTPRGYRVEGLDIARLAELLGRIG